MGESSKGHDNPGALALLRNDIQHGFSQVIQRLDKIEARQKEQNGMLASHETRLTVLERFCTDHVRPALTQVIENRVQLASVLAKYAGAGVGVGGGVGLIVLMLGKAWGWW